MVNWWGKCRNSVNFYFLELQNQYRLTATMKLMMLASWKNDKPRQSIKKQRHHFAYKGPFMYIVKAMDFPVVKYGCESWTIRKAECWRTDAFELWCWRRLLRVPWTARRSVNPKGNQPWVFIGRTGAERKLQYFRHLMWRADSLEKTLILGKIEGNRSRGLQKMK